MKKTITITVIVAVIFIIGAFLIGRSTASPALAPLPAGEPAEGTRGSDYDIDKNINDQTIDNFLGRSDTVYRDVRLLEDTATWENKGGERNITGFVKGFEVVPYAYLTEFPQAYIDQKVSENVSGLYQGDTLFSLGTNGEYIANYAESMDILESLFPKDKYIFLMCGAGGYANFTKKMLVALGWDASKIYNTGGYWFYKGDNNVQVERKLADGTLKYDFWKVAYHDINFSKLTKLSKANQ